VQAAIAVAIASMSCAEEARPIADERRASSQAGGSHLMTTTTTSPTHRHTNRLIDATSPYLQQHAHNPVDWYEWGEAALDKARREDKPIFLSIGYSACHWCHVMERESFENEEIAAIMNQHFVNIKVDREERPDLDEIYMAATQAMSGSGGWPMSVWLKPDAQPFYAGTYFPPDDRYGRPGFKRLLMFLAQAWEKDRDKIDQQAAALTEAVRKFSVVAPGTGTVPYTLVVDAATRLAGAFDKRKGGLSGGGTNKFPPSMAMDLMLRVHHYQQNTEGEKPNSDLLEAVERTLDHMARGGIYDHLGGGIARYSTDVNWLVPHFEKMLYDQALVSAIYLDAYRCTGKPLYGRIAREIFDYVIEDLQSPEGGLYSTRDADSEGEEGKFYVWDRPEVEQILGDDAALFCDYYDVSGAGNWEGKNILNVPRAAEAVAKLHGIGVDALDRSLASSRKKLLEVRQRRVQPHLDDKILASWNGLMIASMAKGYRVLGDKKYADAAVRAAAFVMGRMVIDGKLQRTYRDGRTHTHGYLDDHAFMIEAMLNLYETTFDTIWLDRAAGLNEYVLAHFRDDENGGFFFTSDNAEKVLVRTKDASDSAIPSGSSVQMMNLLRLAVLLDRKELWQEAERMQRVFSDAVNENPFRSERMLAALDFYHRRPKEIAFVAPQADDSSLGALVETAWRTYVPNEVMACLIDGQADARGLAQRIPLLSGKTLVNGKAAAYVCRDFACQAPVKDAASLRELLGR
jgi:uncharacterized protein YyaL (SSP411 family)